MSILSRISAALLGGVSFPNAMKLAFERPSRQVGLSARPAVHSTGPEAAIRYLTRKGLAGSGDRGAGQASTLRKMMRAENIRRGRRVEQYEQPGKRDRGVGRTKRRG